MTRDRGVDPTYLDRAFRSVDRRKLGASAEKKLALSRKRADKRDRKTASEALAALPKPTRPPARKDED